MRAFLAASVVATVRAHEAVGPAPSIQGVEALRFGAVAGEELVEADAFLELDGVACDGKYPSLSEDYMATGYHD